MTDADESSWSSGEGQILHGLISYISKLRDGTSTSNDPDLAELKNALGPHCTKKPRLRKKTTTTVGDEQTGDAGQDTQIQRGNFPDSEDEWVPFPKETPGDANSIAANSGAGAVDQEVVDMSNNKAIVETLDLNIYCLYYVCILLLFVLLSVNL